MQLGNHKSKMVATKSGNWRDSVWDGKNTNEIVAKVPTLVYVHSILDQIMNWRENFSHNNNFQF